jgi:hypothetical protein
MMTTFRFRRRATLAGTPEAIVTPKDIPIGSTVELLQPLKDDLDTLTKIAEGEWISRETGCDHVLSDRKIRTFKVFQNLKEPV